MHAEPMMPGTSVTPSARSVSTSASLGVIRLGPPSGAVARVSTAACAALSVAFGVAIAMPQNPPWRQTGTHLLPRARLRPGAASQRVRRPINTCGRWLVLLYARSCLTFARVAGACKVRSAQS